MLDVLFWEPKASSATWTFFMEAYGQVNCSFWYKKNLNFSSCNFVYNFGHYTDWIRIGIQPKMLDPDPDQMNLDPQTYYIQHTYTAGIYTILT